MIVRIQLNTIFQACELTFWVELDDSLRSPIAKPFIPYKRLEIISLSSYHPNWLSCFFTCFSQFQQNTMRSVAGWVHMTLYSLRHTDSTWLTTWLVWQICSLVSKLNITHCFFQHLAFGRIYHLIRKTRLSEVAHLTFSCVMSFVVFVLHGINKFIPPQFWDAFNNPSRFLRWPRYYR